MPRPTIPDRAAVILDHARAVILEKGYPRATIADIARRAGIGKGAVYLDFPSKEALLDALLARSMRKLAAAVRGRVERHDGPVTLSELYGISMDALLADELMLAFYLADTSVLGDYVRDKGPERYGPRLDWLTGYASDLREAGLLRGDVDPDAASLVMSVFSVGLINAAPVLGDLPRERLARAVREMSALISAGWELDPAGADAAAVRRAHDTLLDRLDAQMGAP
ncbi:TetR/AcrR family transcriptional regulator [Nonomuraea sp. NPDC003214]